VSPWIVRDQAIGLLWKATIPWGAGAFDLTIRDRIGTLNGQWTVEGDGADGKPAAPVALAFDPDTPASVTKPPRTSARVRYASLSVGDRAVTVAALRGAKDELTFLVDAEGAGDLSDTSKRLPTVAQALRRGAVRTGTSWTTGAVDILGAKGVLTAVETLPSIQVSADPASSRSGTTKVAGDPYTLVLLDGDFDGRYTGAADWWGFAPSSSVDSPTNPSRLFEGDRPCWRGASRAWKLLGVRPDGTAVLAPFAQAPSVEEYLRERAERVDRQRWFPKFEAEREDFVRAQGLDASRPTAPQPVRWRYALSLADARVLAMAEGKPLLVDFEADWCVWCKRLDWIIYPDAQVADRLARFTAVKVNVELDPVASFQDIVGADGKGWGGIPAVGVFDGDGRPVTFKPVPDDPKCEVVDHVGRFNKPEYFAAALDAAYEAARARMAGGGGGAVAPGMDGGTK
jgi:thiol-disulfide isomerase/thioredoxin